MTKQGVIVKSVGGVFTVMDGSGNKTVCYSPKKFRYKADDVVIGDLVRFDELRGGRGIISEVLPRKNKLSRPEVANVDVCFIVVACEPQPDFYLVDKVLINCFQQNIEPVLVINKTDITLNAYERALQNYRDVAQIVAVSALDGSVEQLAKYLTDNKVACFAGQSAVGKTSLLNALLPQAIGIVGDLSQKTGRGMHTTRHATLNKVYGGFVADTCGFSLCEIKDIKASQLRLYLDDFVTLSHGCKFASCTHTVEPECAVRRAADCGQLSAERYKRYVEEYAELAESEKNRY